MIDKIRWNKIVVNNSGSPLHSWEWNRTLEEFGHEVKWFFLDDDKASVAFPILVKYRFFGWVPFGMPFKGDLNYINKKLRNFLFDSNLYGIITNNYELFLEIVFSLVGNFDNSCTHYTKLNVTTPDLSFSFLIFKS